MKAIMDCLKIKNQLMEFADNELREKETEAVRLHLEQCPDCAGEYRLMLEINRGITQLPYYEPSLQFNDKVLSALGIAAAEIPVVAVWLRRIISLSMTALAAWVGVLFFVLFPRTIPFIRQLAAGYIEHPQKSILMLEKLLWQFAYAVNDVFIITTNTVIAVLTTPGLAMQLPVAALAAAVLIKLIFRPSFSSRMSVTMKGMAL